MTESSIAIELINVDKHFGAVHANDKVNLSVQTGTIHGIVGTGKERPEKTCE